MHDMSVSLPMWNCGKNNPRYITSTSTIPWLCLSVRVGLISPPLWKFVRNYNFKNSNIDVSAFGGSRFPGNRGDGCSWWPATVAKDLVGNEPRTSYLFIFYSTRCCTTVKWIKTLWLTLPMIQLSFREPKIHSPGVQ